MPSASWVLAACLALVLPGCTSGSSASHPVEAGAGPGSRCAVLDDCPPPTLCAWPVDGGCDAQGVCVTEDLHCTKDGPTVCACDDSPVLLNCIYGAGHAPQPIPSPPRVCMGPPEAGTD